MMPREELIEKMREAILAYGLDNKLEITSTEVARIALQTLLSNLPTEKYYFQKICNYGEYYEQLLETKK